MENVYREAPFPFDFSLGSAEMSPKYHMTRGTEVFTPLVHKLPNTSDAYLQGSPQMTSVAESRCLHIITMARGLRRGAAEGMSQGTRYLSRRCLLPKAPALQATHIEAAHISVVPITDLVGLVLTANRM